MKLDAYYTRMVKEIRKRHDERRGGGTGGDIEILLAIIDHLLKPEPEPER